MLTAPLPLQAAGHREVRLQPVEPGQERDADLVVERGLLEDGPAQRHGRPDGRLVAGQVPGVEGAQRRGGRRGHRGERPEQGVTVPVRVAADQLVVVEVISGVEADPGRQPPPQRRFVAGVEHRKLDAGHLPVRTLGQPGHQLGGGLELRGAPVPGERRVERGAQPVQDHRPVGLAQQVQVHAQIVLAGPGARGQRPAGHQDHAGPGGLHQVQLLLVGLDHVRQRMPARRQLIGARPAGDDGVPLGSARRRAGDQLPRLSPGQAHAALRGVHGLGDPEPVVPQEVPEADRGLPVDLAVRRRRDVRRRVHAPRHRRRIAAFPGGLGDDQRLGAPRQPDRGAIPLHDTAAAARRPGGPRPRTAAPARRAARPWHPRPGPRAAACPRRRRAGTAPTAP